MEPLGIRLLIKRDLDNDMGSFSIKIPNWIGSRLGELLLLSYDGDILTISNAERYE
jgi:hypothetical protein